MNLKSQWDVFATWARAHVLDDRGASVVEYALLVALVAIVCVAAITPLGQWASSNISTLGVTLSGAGS